MPVGGLGHKASINKSCGSPTLNAFWTGPAMLEARPSRAQSSGEKQPHVHQNSKYGGDAHIGTRSVNSADERGRKMCPDLRTQGAQRLGGP